MTEHSDRLKQLLADWIDVQAAEYPEPRDMLNALAANLTLLVAKMGHEYGNAEFGEFVDGVLDNLRRNTERWRVELAE
jgi:hypothetical protein